MSENIIQELQQTIKHQQTEIKELQESVTGLLSKFEEFDERMNFLEQKREEADELVELLNKPVNLDDKKEEDKQEEKKEKSQKEKKKIDKSDKEMTKMKKNVKSLEHDGKQAKMQIHDMKKQLTGYDKTIENVKGEMSQLIELQDQQTKKTETQVQRMLSVTMKNEDMKKGIKQHKFLSKRDKYYIKQWTNLDIGNPVFDSYVDNWKQNAFDIGKSIMGREKLLFVVEDYNGNVFGIYLNERLSNDELSTWVQTSSESFLFSLESKGRINGPKKFMFNPLSTKLKKW